MKTKTFLLICLMLGIGITRLTAQTDAYKITEAGGLFPVTCDGENIEYVIYTCDFKWLAHSQDGRLKWVKVVDCKWTFTNLYGEEFMVREMDPAVEVYGPLSSDRIQEIGTWRAVMIGNRGSHYKITLSYTITFGKDPVTGNETIVDWVWKLFEAKCH